MKIHILLRSIVLVTFVAVASPTHAGLAEAVPVPLEDRSEEVLRLNRRLEEIRDMDRSNLSKAERKALRLEVRMIREELAEMRGGVYLSVGAILLIALLLILLL
jgi:hypothetical protein